MGLLSGMLSLSLACLPGPAPAGFRCSCAGPASARDAATAAHTVVAARVRAMRRIPRPTGTHAWEATLAVERQWKGTGDSLLVVRTSGGGACGFPFVVGITYLVYALPDGRGGLETFICTRTARLSDATADAASLGPGTRISRTPDVVPPPPLPRRRRAGVTAP